LPCIETIFKTIYTAKQNH